MYKLLITPKYSTALIIHSIFSPFSFFIYFSTLSVYTVHLELTQNSAIVNKNYSTAVVQHEKNEIQTLIAQLELLSPYFFKSKEYLPHTN